MKNMKLELFFQKGTNIAISVQRYTLFFRKPNNSKKNFTFFYLSLINHQKHTILYIEKTCVFTRALDRHIDAMAQI
jgi:hypothetical protein